MNRDDELTLRRWLEARDPGAPRGALRARLLAVPTTVRPARFPNVGLSLRAGFGLAPLARPLLLFLLLLVIVAVVAGALILQPWRPFPPRGLLAFAAPGRAVGSTVIVIASADGSTWRQVGNGDANVFDHSPRWSRDGRTLLFARNSLLSALGSCNGVGSMMLYDVSTGAERVIATGLRPIDTVVWSPSGDRAAYTYPPAGCGAEVELGIVDLATGQVTTTIVVPMDSETDPTRGVPWHAAWNGASAVAEPDVMVSTVDGFVDKISVDAPSHDGRTTVRWSWTPSEADPALAVTDAAGLSTELGPGGRPTWSPDDRFVAYVEPGSAGGPDPAAGVRDHVVIATTAGTRRRVADFVWGAEIGPFTSPTVSWTPDGGALYWVDLLGAHVVDVVSGRVADLPVFPTGAADLQWQPANP